MHDFDTGKHKEDPVENEGARVATKCLPLLVFGDFTRQFRAGNSAVRGRFLAEFRTHRIPRFYGCPRFLQECVVIFLFSEIQMICIVFLV